MNDRVSIPMFEHTWDRNDSVDSKVTISLREYNDMKYTVKRAEETMVLMRNLMKAIEGSEIARDLDVMKAISLIKAN